MIHFLHSLSNSVFEGLYGSLQSVGHPIVEISKQSIESGLRKNMSIIIYDLKNLCSPIEACEKSTMSTIGNPTGCRVPYRPSDTQTAERPVTGDNLARAVIAYSW